MENKIFEWNVSKTIIHYLRPGPFGESTDFKSQFLKSMFCNYIIQNYWSQISDENDWEILFSSESQTLTIVHYRGKQGHNFEWNLFHAVLFFIMQLNNCFFQV